MNNIIVKTANSDISKELNDIGFDSSYSDIAKNKYIGKTYKIFNLQPHEANILKQLCLSLGFDCAVRRETIMCKCDYTDAVIFASESQIQQLIEKLRLQPFRLANLAEILNRLDCTFVPLKIRNYVFDWSRPYVMGILNVTNDSFSDGGNYNNVETALNHAVEMIEQGVDIIDIGGESTKPGAESVPVDVEIERVIPVIRIIRESGIGVPISVDTRNYATAKTAIEAGADIVNDVSGLEYDNNMFNFVVSNNIPTVIVHSDSVPARSVDFFEGDIVEEIYFSLYNKIQKLKEAGMESQNIIVDAGIGFGKSVESNFEILKRFNEFNTLGCPLLLGISRKSFITKAFNISSEEADIPTSLYSSLIKNVNIHRVHNVKLVKQYLEYSSKLN